MSVTTFFKTLLDALPESVEKDYITHHPIIGAFNETWSDIALSQKKRENHDNNQEGPWPTTA